MCVSLLGPIRYQQVLLCARELQVLLCGLKAGTNALDLVSINRYLHHCKMKLERPVEQRNSQNRCIRVIGKFLEAQRSVEGPRLCLASLPFSFPGAICLVFFSRVCCSFLYFYFLIFYFLVDVEEMENGVRNLDGMALPNGNRIWIEGCMCQLDKYMYSWLHTRTVSDIIT